MKWVQLADELPPMNTGVLVSDGTVVTVAERGECCGHISWHGHEFGGYEWDWDFDERKISHWMPLPKPPNAEVSRDER